MKKVFACSFFLCIALFLFAQSRPTGEQDQWKMMQFAQFAFDKKDYGTAIRYAEAAKKIKRDEISWSLHILNQALRPQEVRRQGDDLSEVIAIFHSRDSIDAIEVINNIMLKKTLEELDNSVAVLLKLLESSFNFPEVDFILGKIYIYEGEYELAKRYLTNAWEYAFLLDVPKQKIDVLYELAYLSHLTKDFDSFEKTLLLIVADDNLFSKDGKTSNFMSAVVKNILRGMSAQNFFSFYRHEAFQTLKAHFQLAEYYFELENFSLALQHSAMGSIIAFTRLFQVIHDRNNDFVLTDFDSFFKEVTQYSDILAWTSENEIWKGFYFFSQVLEKVEKTDMSHEFLLFLGKSCPEDYWRSIALKHIINQL
ncbi:MAG: tetratricopeptide repeat protein [Treponemataceae bacterium]